MSGATSKWGLPFPTGGDEVIVHADVQALAVKVDLELDNAVATVKPKPIDAADNLDDVALLDKVSETGGATDWAAQNYPANVAGVIHTHRLVSGSSADAHAVQMFVSREATICLWLRSKTDGTWGAWQRIGPGDFPRKVLGAGTDANSLTDVPMNAVAQTSGGTANTPAGVGVLMHYGVNSSTAYGVQMFVSSTNQMWTRYKTANTWGAWVEIGGGKLPAAYGAIDLNTLTRGTRQAHSGAFTNGPTGMDAGMVETTAIQNNDNYLLQTATEWTYAGSAARIWIRRKSGSNWSPWSLVGPVDTSLFATVSSTASAIRPGSGMKMVRVPVTVGHNPAPYTAMTSGAVRLPLRWAFPVIRWRVHIANLDIRSGSTSKPESSSMTGMWVGTHNGSGGWTGTPIKALDAFTVPANGDVYTSPWTDAPIPTSATGEVLLGYGYTTTAAPWEQLGTSYQTTATTDPSIGTGWAAKTTAPFDIVVEVETPAGTPVVASLGDSISVGVGATRGLIESWLNTYARTLGAIPVHGGSSGDTIVGSSTLTAPKFTRWLSSASAPPDALVFALGINDAGGGADATVIKTRFDALVPQLATRIPALFLAEITPRTAVAEDAPSEVARIEHNTYLATLPHGARALWPFVAAVSADGADLDPDKNADGLHPNTAGHNALAAALGVMAPGTADLATRLIPHITPASIGAVAGTTIDPQTAALIGNPASDTSAALRARQPVVNVKDYGAKGDTVLDANGALVSGTDDTAAIVAALTAADATRARVIFPKGIYQIANSTGVVYAGSVDIEGQDATIFSIYPKAFDFSALAKDDNQARLDAGNLTAHIRGLTFAGPPNPPAGGIGNYFQLRLGGFARVVVEDCTFRNANEYPCWLYLCRNVTVQRNRFLSCNPSTGDGDNLVRYVQCEKCDDVRIVDNYFTSTVPYVSSETSFASVSVMLTTVSNVVVARNRIYESGGIECYSEGENITVEKNVIDHCHRYAIKLEESSIIRVRDNAITNSYQSAARSVIGVIPYIRSHSYGSTVLRRGDVIIEGNRIDNCPQPYIITVQGRLYTDLTARIPAATSQADSLVYRVRVIGNTVKNSACISPLYLPFMADVTIEGNEITECPMTVVSAQIDMLGLGERAEVVNNQISFAPNGYTAVGLRFAAHSGYTGAEAWAQIERNTIVNTATATTPQAYGMDLGSLARVRIRGNRTRNLNQHIFARSGGDLLINDNDGPKTTNSVVTTASYTKVTSDLVA